MRSKPLQQYFRALLPPRSEGARPRTGADKKACFSPASGHVRRHTCQGSGLAISDRCGIYAASQDQVTRLATNITSLHSPGQHSSAPQPRSPRLPSASCLPYTPRIDHDRHPPGARFGLVDPLAAAREPCRVFGRRSPRPSRADDPQASCCRRRDRPLHSTSITRSPPPVLQLSTRLPSISSVLAVRREISPARRRRPRSDAGAAMDFSLVRLHRASLAGALP